MPLRNLWRNWQLSNSTRRRRTVSASSRRLAAAAELLELRSMLSTITVTTLTDSVANDGLVSLREAISAANTNASVDGSTAGQSGTQDLIVFQEGLTGTIALNPALGQLVITETVRINGLGAANTIVDAQENSRVFYIDTTAGDVALDHLAVTGGKTTADYEHGAGIRFESSGTLKLTGSVVTENSTSGRGAVGAGIIVSAGNVELVDSILSNNSTVGPGAQAGGLAALNHVTLTNSTVSGNSTAGESAFGGAILIAIGSLTVTDSSIVSNATHGRGASGGAIFTGEHSSVTITRSTVSGNTTDGRLGNGGGIYTQNGTVTVVDSTFSHNSTAGDDARGGAIHTNGGDITVTNSTFADNVTTGDQAHGGALYSVVGDITVNSSTISGNHVEGTGARGGGVYTHDGSVTLTNSIVAGNSADPLSTSQDIAFDNGNGTAILTATNSLIGKNGGTPLAPAPVGSPDSNGNLVGTNASPINPMLRTLADNGGPTQTMALMLGSPAINGGGNTTLANDQRGPGFRRVVDNLLDMGAYEYQLVDTTPQKTIDVVEGGTFVNVMIMTFTSPDPDAVATDFTILSVDWGTTVLNATVAVELVSSTSSSASFRVVATATFPPGSAAGSPYAVAVSLFDNHGYTVETDKTKFEVAPPTTPPRHLDRQTGLAGFYYANGLLAKVLQNGSVLTLIDETGAESSGTIANGTVITAPDFNLSGVFDQAGGTITFSDATVWTKVRQIEGAWLTGTGRVAGIRQVGTELIFTGGTGDKSAGAFTSPTNLVATGWGNITGTLSSDGTRIQWSNNTVWYLIPDFQGDWQSSTGGPTRIEQSGSTLLFVNRSGQTSTGRMISDTQVVTGANWGNQIGTIVGDTIQFSNGTSWSIPSTTSGTPGLGGLWQRSSTGLDTRVLQADQSLTFVSASGSISVGQFVSDTEVFAIDWNQHGTIVGNDIQWANGTMWTRLPYISGAYINQNDVETGINQLEHALTFTDQFGNVTHGTLVGPTNIVEADGDQRTATINNGVIQWSNGPLWVNLPTLSGNWQVSTSGRPTYVEQAGLQLLFVDHAGTVFTGGFVTPTTAQLTQQGIPSPPFVNVTIPDAESIDFGSGLEWTKFPATVLDDVFAAPNFWPFV